MGHHPAWARVGAGKCRGRVPPLRASLSLGPAASVAFRGGPVLEIKVDQNGEYTVCRPVGELDAFTVGQFREALTELGGSRRLVIDLSGVPFLDSAGLGALIGGVRRAREAGGDVAVYGARPAVARLLHTTGFDRVASVSESENDAAKALADSP
ncbi:MAG: STAS domain-containing protein [Actinobacteria bacterium]|nr:STAS domain-containing protein [Actinomycetota bacterium]